MKRINNRQKKFVNVKKNYAKGKLEVLRKGRDTKKSKKRK